MKKTANGRQTTYSYLPNRKLGQVTHHYGHSITFTYLDGMIETVTAPTGDVYRYQYDPRGNLTSVIYPDTTPRE